jgi:hypothetical protein
MILKLAKILYSRLEEQSNDGIFTGSVVSVFKSLEVSQAYYSKLYDLLYDSGCVERIQRGSSHTPSVLRLIRAPDADDFRVQPLTNTKSSATLLEQRVTSIEGRLPNVDLASTITDFETRISDLESQIREVERFGKA